MTHNHALQPTAGKRCLPVPSSRRSSAAAELGRYAAHTQMRGPKPLQVIRIIAFLSLGVAVALTLFAVVAVAVPPGEGAGAAFIRGALEALGYRHESFGAYEAGEVFGSTLFAVLPPLALLFAARTRRLWLLRTAAVLWVLVAAGLGSWTLLPLIAAVLSFLPSVRRYFRGEDADPLVHDVEAMEVPRAV